MNLQEVLTVKISIKKSQYDAKLGQTGRWPSAAQDILLKCEQFVMDTLQSVVAVLLLSLMAYCMPDVTNNQTLLTLSPHHPKEYNGTYHTRFENLDLDLILASRRLVHNYVACLTDVKPCTAEGDELKRMLPDALKTKCAKCSMKQREGAKKVITVLQVRYPDQWRILKKKWDLEMLKAVLSN